MKSLELICILTDFEARPPEKQRDLILTLLETEVGKDIMREIKLPSLLKKFEKANGLVRKCLISSKKAQDYFSKEYSNANEYVMNELSHVLSKYFEECLTDCFVSTDGKFVCLHNIVIHSQSKLEDMKEFTSTVEGSEIHFERVKKFNLWAWINGPDFQSDRIFAFAMLEFVKDKKIHVWWNYFQPEDF